MLHQDDEEAIVEKNIAEMLSTIKFVVIKSYQLEFGGGGQESRKELFRDEKSAAVVLRTSYFLEAKDKYITLHDKAKNAIDFHVKSFCIQSKFPIKYDATTSPFEAFINYIVGGADGEGDCLQSATQKLRILHGHLVENFIKMDIKCEFISEDVVNECKKMERIIVDNNISNQQMDIQVPNERRRKQRDRQPMHNHHQIFQPVKKTLFQQLEGLYNKNIPAYHLSKLIHEYKNDLTEIELLLNQYNVNDFGEVNRDGYYHPSLHIAVEEGKLAVVKLLINKGFDINFRDRNFGGRTALSVAYENGHQEIIDYLTQAALLETEMKDPRDKDNQIVTNKRNATAADLPENEGDGNKRPNPKKN